MQDIIKNKYYEYLLPHDGDLMPTPEYPFQKESNGSSYERNKKKKENLKTKKQRKVNSKVQREFKGGFVRLSNLF